MRIHEEIGQNLAYAKLRIGELANGGEDCGDAVEELRGLLDQAIAGTRALTFELSPPMLHELGFSEAVEWLTEQFTERHGIECCFSDGARDRSLPNDVSVTLFRAVAELLHNVAQHADASSVRVSVNTNNGDIQVRVCDDGRGFNAKEAMQYRQPEDGFGLFSIDERVDYLGGSMEVRSDSLTGTCVILTAPTDGRERS
jgi:signal transduction histidine kinase